MLSVILWPYRKYKSLKEAYYKAQYGQPAARNGGCPCGSHCHNCTEDVFSFMISLTLTIFVLFMYLVVKTWYSYTEKISNTILHFQERVNCFFAFFRLAPKPNKNDQDVSTDADTEQGSTENQSTQTTTEEEATSPASQSIPAESTQSEREVEQEIPDQTTSSIEPGTFKQRSNPSILTVNEQGNESEAEVSDESLIVQGLQDSNGEESESEPEIKVKVAEEDTPEKPFISSGGCFGYSIPPTVPEIFLEEQSAMDSAARYNSPFLSSSASFCYESSAGELDCSKESEDINFQSVSKEDSDMEFVKKSC